MSEYITDPELLSQLNEQRVAQPAVSTGEGYVNDPALLAQLFN